MIRPLKLRLAQWLTSGVAGRLVRTACRNRMPWDGGRIFVDPQLVADQNCASIFFGLYESAERRMTAKFVAAGDRVVELGSSIGGMSCVLHRRVGRQGAVALVEARRELLDLALANVRANHPAASPAAVHGAVDYSRPGEPTITFSTAGSNIDGRVSGGGVGIAVPRYSLQEILGRLPGTWNVLVADIEGAEIGLALHDMGSLRRFHRLLLELHEESFGGRKYSIAEVRELFLAGGHFRLAGQDGHVFCFERLI